MHDLQERLLDTICTNGIDRASVLAHRNLSALMDSLTLLEVVEVLEDYLNRDLPETELTEQNFNSVPTILNLANRLANGERPAGRPLIGEGNEYRAS